MLSKNWKTTLLTKNRFHLLIRNTTVRLLRELSIPLLPIYYLCSRGCFLSGGAVAQAIQGDYSTVPNDIDIFVPTFHKDAQFIHWPTVTKMFEENGFRLRVPPAPQDSYSGGLHFTDCLLLRDEGSAGDHSSDQYVSRRSTVQATFQYVSENLHQFDDDLFAAESTIIQIILMNAPNANTIVNSFDINICKSFISIQQCHQNQPYCSMHCGCYRSNPCGCSLRILNALSKKTFRYDGVANLNRLLNHFRTSELWLVIRQQALQRMEKYIEKGYAMDWGAELYHNLLALSSIPLVIFHTDENGIVTRSILFEVL
jgi:hypothetical protein